MGFISPSLFVSLYVSLQDMFYASTNGNERPAGQPARQEAR